MGSCASVFAVYERLGSASVVADVTETVDCESDHMATTVFDFLDAWNPSTDQITSIGLGLSPFTVSLQRVHTRRRPPQLH